ncbi:MAG TPA: hypothetical protein ENI52_03995 [Thermoplasmata archaeon]|nr:hypothetical protein [Thermoplasmata archaeon]
MINIAEIYDLISRAFHKSDNFFHWGDNAIIQGSLANLPAPDDISKRFRDDEYFAIVNVESIQPENAGNDELLRINYNYLITLCHKGKTGDLTKLRNDMVNKFYRGWCRFWKETYGYIENTEDISLSIPELEMNIDIIAVQFNGTITEIVSKGGIIHG